MAGSCGLREDTMTATSILMFAFLTPFAIGAAYSEGRRVGYRQGIFRTTEFERFVRRAACDPEITRSVRPDCAVVEEMYAKERRR